MDDVPHGGIKRCEIARVHDSFLLWGFSAYSIHGTVSTGLLVSTACVEGEVRGNTGQLFRV